jgi:adenylate cyclase class 2
MRGMEQAGSGLEIEVKLGVASLPEAHRRLAALPATLTEGRQFEDNDIFDLPDGRLAAAKSLLRLRLVGSAGMVTFKSLVEGTDWDDVRVKVRAEVQTPVGAPEAMRNILLRLGFSRVYRYQKYRSYYRWTDPASGAVLSISLDETPIGIYIELEGDKPAIDNAAGRMGWAQDDYIVDDYRTLHLAWLEQRGLPSGDMVFQ